MRLLVTFALLAAGAFAASSVEPTSAQIDDIIQKFAAKEAEFAKARGNYTYRQTARIQEVDDGGNVHGKYEIVSDIVFTPEGKRTERVVHAPVSTLQVILLTPEDEQDLRDVQPFVLTTNEIPNYYVRYLGRETLDEISCYSFAVKPKKMEQGKRYFEGIVWVDDKDLQIVKSYGRGIGLLKRNSDNQFPKFETYREQIDGKNWFPTYTAANDTLNFKDMSQRIKMTVKYEDYKQFKTDVQIKYDTEESGKTPPSTGAPATPAPPKKP
jgi:outer membrane lipoprotein-sorting protein